MHFKWGIFYSATVKYKSFIEQDVAATSFIQLNFNTTEDEIVFKQAALHPPVIEITTKDYDFVKISNELGSKPGILYLNIWNVTNNELKEILKKHFSQALKNFNRIQPVPGWNN